MLNLTTGELRDNYFQSGMRKLAHHCFKKPVDSYNVAKLFKSYGDALEISQKPFMDMAKRHAILDDKGEFRREDSMPPESFRIREDAKDAWEKDVKEFFALPVELVGTRVSLTDCVAAGLNPAEISKMDAVINPMIEAEKPSEPARP